MVIFESMMTEANLLNLRYSLETNCLIIISLVLTPNRKHRGGTAERVTFVIYPCMKIHI